VACRAGLGRREGARPRAAPNLPKQVTKAVRSRQFPVPGGFDQDGPQGFVVCRVGLENLDGLRGGEAINSSCGLELEPSVDQDWELDGNLVGGLGLGFRRAGVVVGREVDGAANDLGPGFESAHRRWLRGRGRPSRDVVSLEDCECGFREIPAFLPDVAKQILDGEIV
jgi:hypothetical protein